MRCERVEAIRWNVGAVIPAAARSAMCRSEVDYFKAYSALVLQYLEDVKADLTLVRGKGVWGGGTSHPSSSSPAREAAAV